MTILIKEDIAKIRETKIGKAPNSALSKLLTSKLNYYEALYLLWTKTLPHASLIYSYKVAVQIVLVMCWGKSDYSPQSCHETILRFVHQN